MRWAKRRRKIVRRDNGKVVEFEEVRYGLLMWCMEIGAIGVVFGAWAKVLPYNQYGYTNLF